VLQLLLEHGGDPNIRSSYNKNAWDLARDELDAAEKVVRSRAEIRQVLVDHDQMQVSKLFGTGSSIRTNGNTSDIYRDLGEEGSAVVMQLEMHADSTAAYSSSYDGDRPKNKKEGKKGSAEGGASKSGTRKKSSVKK
jgi:hypothetical protein